jgi:putative endonuclease
MSETWWVYLIICRNGSIYTGIAKDVEARFRQHAAGKGARYTRMHPPLALLARRQYPSRREAAQAEWFIKSLSPRGKREWAVAHGTDAHCSPCQ